MTLTNEEYNILNKLSHKTKMDCWFWLKTDAKGNDYVYDLENRKKLSLKQGILELNDGIDDVRDYNLEYKEIECYKNLINKLKGE